MIINEVIQSVKKIERIINKYENDKELSLFETDSYCSFKMVEDKGIESLPNICEDFKFQSIYLCYNTDLTFKSEYHKPKFGISIKENISIYQDLKKVNEEIEDNNEYNEKYKETVSLRKVENDEIKKDIEYLDNIASVWLNTINITKHTDQKLKVISEETREIIRKLKRNSKAKETPQEILNNEIKITLWKSKYIHCKGILIAEEIGSNLPYELEVNNVKVFFTYKTLIHILYRHFGQMVSNNFFQEAKSYHSPIFLPNKIHLTLENIFKRLSNNKYFKKIEIKHNESYNFEYKETKYQLYFKEFGNQKNKLMVSSIYPIEKEEEIKNRNSEKN